MGIRVHRDLPVDSGDHQLEDGTPVVTVTSLASVSSDRPSAVHPDGPPLSALCSHYQHLRFHTQAFLWCPSFYFALRLQENSIHMAACIG